MESSAGLSFSSRRSLEGWQLERVRETVRRCRERSPFYQRLSVPSTFEEFQKAPTMDARDLAQNASRLLLSSQSEVAKVVTDQTSATTGPAKRVYYSKEDIERTVAFFACGIGEFVGRGDRCLVLMPGAAGDGLCALVCRALERIGAVSVPCPLPFGFGGAMRLIRETGATKAVALPAHLLSLSRFARMSGQNLLMEGVLVSGDSCSQALEGMIAEELGCRAFPHYGSREMCLGGAITCRLHSGMHVRESEFYFEILDKAGAPAPSGEVGEICFTTLLRRAMPLVRYRTGDEGFVSKAACGCGSLSLRLFGAKRARAPEWDIEKLGDILFGERSVVDFRARREGKRLIVEAALSGNAEEKRLEKKVEAEFGPTQLSCAPAQGLRGPMYEGKRYISATRF